MGNFAIQRINQSKHGKWRSKSADWKSERNEQDEIKMKATPKKLNKLCTASNPNKITTPLKSTRVQLEQKFNLQSWKKKNFSQKQYCYANNCEMFSFLRLMTLECCKFFGCFRVMALLFRVVLMFLFFYSQELHSSNPSHNILRRYRSLLYCIVVIHPGTFS